AFFDFFFNNSCRNRTSRKPEAQTGRMLQRAIDALRKSQSTLRKMALKLEVAHASALVVRALKFRGLALFLFANSFERPVLRRSIPNGWREIPFAGDQIGSVKFSFERQGSGVTTDIAH